MRIDRRDFVRAGTVGLGGLITTRDQGGPEPAVDSSRRGNLRQPTSSPVTVELHVVGGFALVFEENTLTVGTVRAHMANEGACHYPQHGMQLELEHGSIVSDTSNAPFAKTNCSATPCLGRWILDGLHGRFLEGGVVGGKLAYNQSPKPRLSFPSPTNEPDWNNVAFIHAPADYDTNLKRRIDWLTRLHSTFAIAQGGTISVLKPSHPCVGEAVWSVKPPNGRTSYRKPLTSAIRYSATNPDSSGHVELAFGDPRAGGGNIKIQAAADNRVRLRLIATSYEPEIRTFTFGMPMHHLGLAYALYESVPCLGSRGRRNACALD